MKSFDVQALRHFAIERWPREMGHVHGVSHWDRVARNGERLYVEGADRDVIAAFAYLHDSQRLTNGPDLEHGPRAARFVDEIRDTYLNGLTDSQIALLKEACELHTVEHRTGNPTVDICFDSDRLDLPRVGIMPDPQLMATPQGARLARGLDDEQGYVQRDRGCPLKRYVQTMDLKADPQLIAEYRRRHSQGEVWPEVLAGIREVGVLEMEVYLLGTRLVMIVDAPVDFDWASAMARLATLPRQQEWEAYMALFQQCAAEATSDEKWQMMERIFHLYPPR